MKSVVQPATAVSRLLSHQRSAYGVIVKVSIVTRVRIGFAAAIFVTLIGVETMAAAGINVRQLEGAATCLGLGLGGFLIWVTSGLGTAKPRRPIGDRLPLVRQPAEEDPLAPFRSRRYWGIMLVLSAAALAAASAYRYAPPKERPAVAVPPPGPAVVTFPPLKLEGIILHGSRSSAIINGQVVFLGEGIGNVRLVAVDAGHATVELNGQTNVLSLPKPK